MGERGEGAPRPITPGRWEAPPSISLFNVGNAVIVCLSGKGAFSLKSTPPDVDKADGPCRASLHLFSLKFLNSLRSCPTALVAASAASEAVLILAAESTTESRDT